MSSLVPKAELLNPLEILECIFSYKSYVYTGYTGVFSTVSGRELISRKTYILQSPKQS